MSERIYLGDGAYVRSDAGWYLWVEAERVCPTGCSVITHAVALEPVALIRLVRYAAQLDPDLGAELAAAANIAVHTTATGGEAT